MATLTYQAAKTAGVTLTMNAASGGGDAVAAKDNGVLIVKNGDATSTTVTVVTPGNDKYGVARPDVTFSVAAGATAVLGPFPKDLVDPVTHLVGLTYSKVTALTVGALLV